MHNAAADRCNENLLQSTRATSSAVQGIAPRAIHDGWSCVEVEAMLLLTSVVERMGAARVCWAEHCYCGLQHPRGAVSLETGEVQPDRPP